MSERSQEGEPDGPALQAGAIIVAAGRSRRMGGADKIMTPVMDLPLIAHSVKVFNECSQVDKIVLVIADDSTEEAQRLVREHGWDKVKDVCTGGKRRQDSVRYGLARIQDCEWAIVHDGARPCVDSALIERGLLEARETGAAVAAVPVRDTVKTASPSQMVSGTISREGLWAVQTPQVFKTSVLSRAHEDVADDVTDDASMVERVGGDIKIFMGAYQNIKVTSSEDLTIAEAILRARAGAEKAPRR